MGIEATTEEATYQEMLAKLEGVVPDIELRYKAHLAYQINQLKKQHNAIILGHNYMEAALFASVPDYTGDSLELCRRAAETDADIIVFCGVEFMAESAKILNPDKTVLIPSQKAGCSLAESIDAEDIRKLKEKFPGVPVVTYINSYAATKAETDVCCTSGNAANVVRSLQTDTVIFLPDEYLAKNVARDLGMKVVYADEVDGDALRSGELKNTMIAWRGRCEVHEMFTTEDITNVRKQFPNVLVLAHPECSPEVVDEADFAGSTTALIKQVQDSNAEQYLLLTECSMGDNIIAQNPDKDLLRLCSVRCPHMNQITLEDTLEALQKNQYEIDVPKEIRDRARTSLDRMVAIR
ncbi:quinolinate synthase NadA [Pseudomonadota bacterium]